MHYYRVLVARPFGQRDDGILTYASPAPLQPGQLVVVPFGQGKVSGLVKASVAKPAFNTKPVARTFALPPLPEQYIKLIDWLSDYYACGQSNVLQAMLPPRLVSLPEKFETGSLPSAKTGAKQPPLTDEQRKALQAISGSASKVHILHGETGSGKTRLYIELAREALRAGRHALILVPEISLTAQTIERLHEAFGESVQLYHSGLADAARRATWLQALGARQPQVWIGTRSALFLPLARLGLIAIDESHDPSYKQDSVPRYHATLTAAALANLNRTTKVVLGSATPLISDLYLGRLKKVPVHRLTKPVYPGRKPSLQLVDLRDRARFPRHRWLSRQLEAGLEETLSRGEQAILFLNRRGSAPIVLCGSCGWQALCPNCHLPQTYHGDRHDRRCHVCNRSEAMVNVCPQCSEPDLLLKGCGTKEIEAAVSRRFPKARILRFDQDNIGTKDYALAYRQMKDGLVDIIVGTQMLAKGFDLPGVTMIGIIHADASLSLPDFSAAERTFQLLYQVMGRGGRRRNRHHVVVQTYRPDHPVVKAALSRDWEGFYRSELGQRAEIGFPPHRFLLRVRCRARSPASANSVLSALAKKVPASVNVLGPSPAFHGRSGVYYIWDLVMLSPSRRALTKLVRTLPGSCSADLDPLDLL